MKIFVAGSTRTVPTELHGPFKKACREIGEAFAKNGYDILIGSDTKQSADRYVVEGANSVRGKHQIVVYRPSEAQGPYNDPDDTLAPFSNEVLSNIEIRYHYTHATGPWTVAHAAGIRGADAVLLIGGENTTAFMGHIAPVLEKPVLALPLFHGAAKNIWDVIGNSYLGSGISADELQKVSVRWQPSSSDAVVSVLQKIYKKNPFKKSQGRVLYGIGAGVIVCVFLWMTLFIAGVNNLYHDCSTVYLDGPLNFCRYRAACASIKSSLQA
jgi:hypothetical protein